MASTVFHLNSDSILAHQVQGGLRPHPYIKNIIAVASGKGGVGKSTVAANLAAALHQAGAQVGILDADIYGPSIPQIMGAYEKPIMKENRMQPVMRHGIATMSMGYLVDIDTPMIWRGPMVSRALQQLLNETDWGTLDFLILDLPPGTGDIQLTMCQKIPLSGAVVVTTPQDLSLIDARRAIAMFRKINVSILGVIENMSLYHCPHCGHAETIFGSGAGAFLAQHEDVKLLAQLPLALKIREDSDSGCPTVLCEDGGPLRLDYIEAARALIAVLHECKKDKTLKFPKIVVE